MTKPSPRDLDPNYVAPVEENVPMIVYREYYMEGDVRMSREHRVPLSEWTTYERENGL